MVAYRVYGLDGINRFTRTAAIEAVNDECAVRQARVLLGDCVKAEIWERNRLVARLNNGE